MVSISVPVRSLFLLINSCYLSFSSLHWTLTMQIPHFPRILQHFKLFLVLASRVDLVDWCTYSILWSQAVAESLSQILVVLFCILFLHRGSCVSVQKLNLKRERKSKKELFKCSTFSESLLAKEGQPDGFPRTREVHGSKQVQRVKFFHLETRSALLCSPETTEAGAPVTVGVIWCIRDTFH